MGNDKNNCLAPRSKNCFGSSYRTPQPIKHFNPVKFWLSTGIMPRSPNFNGPFFIYTLLRRCWASVCQRKTHLTGRQLRMVVTNNACQRGKILFYLPLYSYWTWFVLRLLLFYTRLIYWRDYFYCGNSSSFFRVRFTLRSNIFLRGNCYHQFVFRHSLYRRRLSQMNMRRIRSGSTYFDSLFFSTFFNPASCSCSNYGSPSYTTSNRQENPLGVSRNFDKVKFHPYFTRKDLFGFFGMLAFLVGLCLVAP